MREVGRDLWAWLADGAAVYVVGAISMGKDVERALAMRARCKSSRHTTERLMSGQLDED